MSGRKRNEDRDAVTEVDPEAKGSEVAEQTEDEANQPGRLAGTVLMLRDIWRLIRGEDERGRKVRWLLGLLRPYRLQVSLMMVAIVVATVAVVSPYAADDVRRLDLDVSEEVDRVERWLVDGPLGLSERQVQSFSNRAEQQLRALGNRAVRGA